MKRKVTLFCVLASACAFAASPSASVTGVLQNADGDIQIDYALAGGPAIVTLELATNGAPVAASALRSLDGDVNRLVTSATGVITWRADVDIPEATFAVGDVTAALTAWPVDNPPDYVVIPLSSNVFEQVRYYASSDALPGGLLENDEYRLTKMVMRRIRAKGVPAVMGGVSSEPGYYANNELGGATDATLDHDFYMAVFEVTGAQWHELGVNAAYTKHIGTTLKYTVDAPRRPCTAVRYYSLRGVNATELKKADDDPAADPPAGSLLANARNLTGLAFDLPTEGEWEFACRARTGHGCWNNGTSITNTSDYATAAAAVDLGFPGRYKYNGGYVFDGAQGKWVEPAADADVTIGPAVVGSSEPNAFGLYDMHGNVREWCLDFWKDDARSLHGALNTTYYENPNYPGYGVHVLRGGGFPSAAKECRSSWRNGERTSNSYSGIGVRLVCSCPLTAAAE